jgi:hypothetical protein
MVCAQILKLALKQPSYLIGKLSIVPIQSKSRHKLPSYDW